MRRRSSGIDNSSDFYIYTYISPRAGLGANLFSHEVCGTCVNGEAYIFKRESDANDMDPDISDTKTDTSKTPVEKFVHRAAYVDMHAAFVESVAKNKGQVLERSEEIGSGAIRLMGLSHNEAWRRCECRQTGHP